ncbi:MAG: MFS transporter [Candidatus Sericytochromatia bacterium]|nr:MFS transporter [Candidatus Sericytochromatia bacterium]
MITYSRVIWLLALVSLLTDISSEMLYPVMPFYLKQIGFSMLVIGCLEGLAEALAGLSKGYFGQVSDLTGKRVSFIRGGYLLSALAKPLLAVSPWIFWVFGARLLDRLGKGLRTAPRDALLSSQATPQTQGQVFGLHRGMDTLGAVIGPVFALGFLLLWPGLYQGLFLLAFIPASLGVSLTFLLKDSPHRSLASQTKQVIPFWGYFSYWEKATPGYRRLVAPMLFFGLMNASDAFLLLRAQQLGWSENGVIALYIGYNLLYALAALPVGHLADQLGMRRLLQVGLLLFSAVYAGFAWNQQKEILWLLFAVYAIYAACNESLVKAWISKITPEHERGTALGFYVSLSSLMALLASVLAGVLWQMLSPVWPFAISASGALLVWVWMVWQGPHIPEQRVIQG